VLFFNILLIMFMIYFFGIFVYIFSMSVITATYLRALLIMCRVQWSPENSVLPEDGPVWPKHVA
jgi:hypothetical protein